jgi:CRP/FNR family transcriptional regulator, cyclic AMP receptor protein
MVNPGQQPTPERRAAVRVLDAVPELAEEISDDRLEGARRHAIAATIELVPGRWQASASDLGEAGGYGLMIVDGLMTRDIVLGQTTASELVGSGDLLRPNDHEGAVSPVQFDVAWNVLEPTRLAVLDRRFAIVTARWPEVATAITRAAVRRAHALTYQIAVGHMTRVDSRLLVLFWYLADRWGRMTPEGVVIPIKLTHQVLGRIVGAQRPSVTTALSTLSERGALNRADDGTWVLHGEPPDEYRRISEPHHRVIDEDELENDEGPA